MINLDAIKNRLIQWKDAKNQTAKEWILDGQSFNETDLNGRIIVRENQEEPIVVCRVGPTAEPWSKNEKAAKEKRRANARFILMAHNMALEDDIEELIAEIARLENVIK